MGCPVSKTLQGQTGQVSLSQSDTVFNPQTCLTSLKTHSGPQERLMPFPHTAGLCWFTALVRSPHKHLPHVIIRSFKGTFFAEVQSVYLQFAHLSIWWNIPMMMGFFHLYNRNRPKILILVYLAPHSLSGVNVYLKSHKGKFSCHPF